MSDKKYEFTGETKIVFGVTLKRIRAVRAIGFTEAGTIGGWISSEANLSQVSGNTWVSGDAQVSGNAWVSGDARVYGNAQVSGDAWVYGDARVSGDAQVYGNARVYGDAQVYGDAWVYGNTWVSGDAQVYGNARVYGDAQVYGDAWVYGNARVYGNAQVSGNARVSKPIVVATRSDGYTFTLTHQGKNAPRIAAGRRFFTMKEAREHWTRTRGGTPLGAETDSILDHFERMIAAGALK